MASHPNPECSVLVIGSANVDRISHVSRFPYPGETIVGAGPDIFIGGKGANQAAAVAQLIGSCTFVGAVGNDPDGTRVIDKLASQQVDTRYITIDPERPTGTAHVTVDSDGENMIVVHPGANASGVPVDRALPRASVVVLSLEIGLQAVLRALRSITGTVILNASPAQPLPVELIDRSSIIIVNETEYDSMPEVGRAPHLIVTLGSRGADLIEDGHVIAHADAPKPARTVNTVGAGDAFCGAIAASVAAGLKLPEALSVASAVGSAAVEWQEPQPQLHRLDHYRSAADFASSS